MTLERRLSPVQLERRRQALDAARLLASEVGYEGFTMQAVADRCGVTRMTLYRYFASKDALLAELVHSWGADIERDLREQPPEGDTDAERVGVALGRVLEVACTEALLTDAVLTALLSRDPAARRAKRGLASVIQGYIDAATGTRLPEAQFAVLSHVLFSVHVNLAYGDITRGVRHRNRSSHGSSLLLVFQLNRRTEMVNASGPSTPAITEDDAAIAAAIEQASVPCLAMSMIHMSGDTSILDSEFRPLGLFINEFQGYMSEEAKTEIRSRALEVIKKFRDGGCELPPPPDESTIRRMMSYLVAQEIPSEYLPMMREELELDGIDRRTDAWSEDEVPREAREDFPVLVIGGGVSGVLTAIRLAEAGIPFTVVEKNASVGGTWFENRYPGARVDVANHLYCYSFEPSHNWTKFFSQQSELQRYFENCVQKYSLSEHFRFSTEVLAARYDADENRWHTTIRNPDGTHEELVSRVVVSAVGQLNRPSIPDIPGRQDFQGPTMHSAAYDTDVDVFGKRVAVVGSGASSFQLVPEIAKTAQSVTVFQRTANWMFQNPLYHDEVPAGKKWCLQHLPFYARWFRFLIFWPALDGAYDFAVVDKQWPHQERSINAGNDGIREMFAGFIKEQVGDDEELLKRSCLTTPRWESGYSRTTAPGSQLCASPT